MTRKQEMIQGMTDGIPIALGYLSVSFGFGITAVRAGLTVLASVMISLTNLTSAGQAEGVHVIVAGGTLIEMALVQLIINLRYSLMSLTLSQKLDKSFTLPHRLMAAYGVTDEIFAVCSTRPTPLTPYYMYGVTIVSAFGWVAGTFAGAAAGAAMPEVITSAMGILLYGMFLAIIIPPTRKDHRILAVILMAAAFSTICKFLLPFISSGFAVILCSITAAAIGAWIFPVKEEKKP